MVDSVKNLVTRNSLEQVQIELYYRDGGNTIHKNNSLYWKKTQKLQQKSSQTHYIKAFRYILDFPLL